MNLVLFGPPGSGKGTQSQLLAKQCGMLHIATGDIIRKEIESRSSLGVMVKNMVAKGEYVSDEIIIKMFEKVINQEPTKNLLCDGFPRTLSQAEALQAIISHYGKVIHCIVEININEKKLFERILKRYTCAKCLAIYNANLKPLNDNTVCDVCEGKTFNKRADDTEETIKRRFNVYQTYTSEILKYYKNKNISVIVVDGDQSVDQVQNEIKQKIGRA